MAPLEQCFHVNRRQVFTYLWTQARTQNNISRSTSSLEEGQQIHKRAGDATTADDDELLMLIIPKVRTPRTLARCWMDEMGTGHSVCNELNLHQMPNVWCVEVKRERVNEL